MRIFGWQFKGGLWNTSSRMRGAGGAPDTSSRMRGVGGGEMGGQGKQGEVKNAGGGGGGGARINARPLGLGETKRNNKT